MLPNTICILKKKYIKIITTHAIDFSSSCIWAYFKFYVTYMFIFIMKRVVLFLYLFLVALVFIAVHKLSLVVVSRGYSLVAVCRLIMIVASFVAKHRL